MVEWWAANGVIVLWILGMAQAIVVYADTNLSPPGRLPLVIAWPVCAFIVVLIRAYSDMRRVLGWAGFLEGER